MILSINFSSKAVIVFLAVLICLSGCAPTGDTVTKVSNGAPGVEKKLRIAVLPFSNLSGTPAPLEDIRKLLINSLKTEGLDILDEEALERFIVNHRIRYVGGITRATAQDLKLETGADAVLITSVELYSEAPPPKISLTSRLVFTGKSPVILWMVGKGLAGDESVGIFELSLIDDPQKLLRKAVRHLTISLIKYLSGEGDETDSQRKIVKFWPKEFYRSPIVEPTMKYHVAVVPFLNLSERKFAEEIMAHHFVRQLRTLENFTVIEPGMVRQALLKYRIIMDEGMSLADADALFSKLDVDLILSGKIFDYQDYLGATGKPKVGFSALLIEKKSREVVWTCLSKNEGDDSVFFFDWGKINTAHTMASEMVLSAVETIIE